MINQLCRSPVFAVHRTAARTLIFFLLGGGAFASEGRMPISQPVVITQPGSYVVTSDIVTSSSAITIAASPVMLDLNGHTLSNPSTPPDPNEALIDVLPSATDVRIENGFLIGGDIGVNTGTTAGSIRIEGVQFRGQLSTSILTRAKNVLIRGCTLRGAGMGMGIRVSGFDPQAGGAWGGGRVESNSVAGYQDGIYVEWSFGMIVRDNVVERGMTLGLLEHNSPGGLVYRNSVFGDEDTWGILVGASHTLIRDNTVTRAVPGITVSVIGLNHGNLIADNVLRACVAEGIFIDGQRSFVEGNLSESNVPYDSLSPGCGITFNSSLADGHVYRNNMLRNNPGGAVCNGSGATDAGGNIQ